jgi:UDP-N-acetylmuramoyl-L-alanine---L-glutamate ligase
VNLEELCASRVALWGMGSEGLAMDALLAERGVVPLLVDDRAGQVGVRTGSAPGRTVVRPDQVVWRDVDVVVRAPGVSRYRPELAAAEKEGVSVTTAMALWLEDFADARVVAVTGTKGKSTTAALAAAILRHEGLEVALIGNIGVPVTETYDRPLADAYVVEISSYQAADATVAPGVCVLTSLAPDHLDWHRGVESYYRDKLHLIEVGPPGALAVSAASEEALRRTASHPNRTLFGPTGRVQAGPSGVIVIDGEPLEPLPVLRVPGQHNVWNLCGAIAGALLLVGRSPSIGAIGAAVDGFDGLPSRCRTVGERGGLTFVDDALASNPFATVSSLDAFPGRELTVILGGADRGVDTAGLVEALAARRPVPRVVVLTPDNARLADSLGAGSGGEGSVPTVELARDLEDAVGLAVQVTPAGGVILFSPAAPTPDGEGDFAARSRRFVQAAGLTAGSGR